MMSLLFIVVPIILSWVFLRRYFQAGMPLLLLGLSLLIPVIVLAWLTMVSSMFINPTTASRAFTILLLLTLGAVASRHDFHFNRSYLPSRISKIKALWKRNWVSIVASSLLLLLFGFLLFTHSARESGGKWFSAGSSWGDLPLHLTYINYFSRQDRLSLISPLFAQRNTTYPFLFDWYTSILFRMGTPIQVAIIVSQLQVFAAAVALAVALYRKIDTRVSTTLFALGLFFAGGGLGWWYFWGDWQQSTLTLLGYLQNQPWQYANISEKSIHFSTVITDMLLPQRGFVVGLAAILSALHMQLEYFSKGKRRYIYFSSILIGLTPLFHIHSFFWVTGLWFFLSLNHVLRKPKALSTLLESLIMLLAIALPQLLWFAVNGAGTHFLRLQPGWMLNADQLSSPLTTARLFMMNFGITSIFLPLIPICLWKCSVKKPFSIVLNYSLLVFVVCLFVSFQPWAYDNLKFMMPSYFFFCIFMALTLANWWKGWKKVIVVLIMIIGTFSGSLSIIRELFLRSELASAHEIESATQLKFVLSPGEITLTTDDHNHPIPMLVGQPIVLGYQGWLWSHGVDASKTAADVERIYSGLDNTTALLEKYHVRYVYISDRERGRFAVNEAFWASHYLPVYQDNEIIVYDTLKQRS
ncbi:hypothetical protein KBC79_03720 [Candidatus Woesebacteria bacterium]|nr:hypothetical protein [Candidatus Woesebacteria bacterium]